MKRVLLIDDDTNLCKVLAHQLGKQDYQVETARNGREGVERFAQGAFDVVVTDIQMPGMNGIEVLEKIRRRDRQVGIILMTAFGSVDNAIEACKMGADDYITKPFSQEQLLFVLEKARRLKELESENLALKQSLSEKYRFGKMIARSPAMQSLLETARRVAVSEATVLILGESGTGKELLAKAIHYNSPRKEKPLITVNCPSIPDNLIESELFGHKRGAFTGAVRDRKGKFEAASGGSIFLDEIGDLQESVQAKLLRVLQEKEVESLGDNRVIKVDVRVIAATNQNLEELIRAGRFREDLYYRLSVVPVTIPPLRDRKEDIALLADFFVEKFSKGKRFRMDASFLDALQKYEWPGNVRELENTIERAIVLSDGEVLSADSLPGNFSLFQPSSASGVEPRSLADVERQAIVQALKACGGNKTHAARMLKIPRHVLLYRLKKLKLT